ncbi:MAG: hypothetical protein WCI93_00890 [bacterium]
MKDVLDYFEGADLRLVAAAIVAFFLFVIIFFRMVRKVILNAKEIKGQKNALDTPLGYEGKLLKILKVDQKADRILLGINPTSEKPFGDEEKWFLLKHVPKNMRIESFVLIFKEGSYTTSPIIP